ncbi:MAG: hypothetical protein Q4F11_01720 [Eubacteriales bacterium]|nr:hypothetical protein [Eubacteriales bacterium]
MQNVDMRIIFAVIVAAVVIYTVIQNKRQACKKSIDKLMAEWGVRPKRQYTMDEYEKISHYFKNGTQENVIDDITWNDLNMDDVFCMINNTNSSVGEEYLYKRLRNISQSKKTLDETERLASFFDRNEKDRINIQKIFKKLGHTRRISISDYVDLLMDLETGSNLIHYMAFIILLAAVIFCVFYNPVIGIWAMILSIAFSVITYYKYKARVEHYFVCVNQIIRMLSAGQEIRALGIKELKEYNQLLERLDKAFTKVKKNAWLLETGTIDGSLAEIILDYIRMLTHVDLIKFNNVVRSMNNKTGEVYELMDTLGFIESSIAVASFRRQLPYWSIPEFVANTGGYCGMEVEKAFHPLIEKPVANSITARKHVLLTGSNASGKSTFLKTIAINTILSQTINTSVSERYRAPEYRIYSSMALKDDLSNSNSYYIVEIKSLKRILDAVNETGMPVLCFVDEVLRGTNTVERIAASSEILKSISGRRALCFAATHDIELTSMLVSNFDNYHFQEEVSDNNVIFNFKLFKGPATTRNAIKLLNMIGYNPSIISGAERKARHFLDNGTWDC